MTQLSLLYFSGYGHTQKQAEAVRDGAQSVAGVTVSMVVIDKEGNLSDADWQTLNDSDAIILGSPTYMGGPAWQFKKMADASSKIWSKDGWKDKIAAGFTNSATINGDKFSTISYLFTLAMQHGMIWVGTGMKASNREDAQRNDINWLGGYSGLLAQSPADASPEEGPLPGDLETARLFGTRVAEAAARRGSR